MGLRVDPVRYDAVIYALGNSWFHHDTLALARRYPGIAWFHDVDLTGLYITYMHRLLARPNGVADARALCAEVRSRYGARMPDLAASVDLSWATYEPYRRAGTRFTVELARDAQTCLVPSERARTALEIDAGPPEILPPLHVVPLAVPEPAA